MRELTKFEKIIVILCFPILVWLCISSYLETQEINNLFDLVSVLLVALTLLFYKPKKANSSNIKTNSTTKKHGLENTIFITKNQIGNFQEKETIRFCAFSDYLELKELVGKRKVSLKYNQITDVFFGSTNQLELIDKSSVKRGLAGAFLLGGAGLIMGSASGVGTKEVRNLKNFIIITFISSNGEENIMYLEENTQNSAKSFAKKFFEITGFKNSLQQEIDL